MMNIQVPDDFLRALDSASLILSATAQMMQGHADAANDPSLGTRWSASQSEIDTVAEVAHTLHTFLSSDEARDARVALDLQQQRPTYTDGRFSGVSDWGGIIERAFRDSSTDPLEPFRDSFAKPDEL
ncbi:hypothetical protein [Curtobacterium flaccumfaciens]|uniref:hypothetical protein n=1 Tax=Curtobacterium flaccumfaciens TaxID=2035 RepID=UPI0016004A1E|nr:hypothetical protein [Curtobacterium flaccumfaciens]MBB1195854.1 hypothetical protein [Curtobacterium flaccumfaciens]